MPPLLRKLTLLCHRPIRSMGTLRLIQSLPLERLKKHQTLRTTRTWSEAGCDTAVDWGNRLKTPKHHRLLLSAIATRTRAVAAFSRRLDPDDNMKTEIRATAHHQTYSGRHLDPLADLAHQLLARGPQALVQLHAHRPESH